MKKVLTMMASLLAITIFANDRIVFIDGDNGAPVSGATVFSKSGTIVGLTDSDGSIKISNNKDYPLAVKCLGFEPSSDIVEGTDTIELNHTTFELNEVVVTTAERPVTHLLCYIREYMSGCTSTDTVMYFNEHVGDFLLADKKVKGFKSMDSPRILRTRSYARVCDSKGNDSIFRPKYRNDSFAWEKLIRLSSDFVRFPEKITNGETTDTVNGKYGVKDIVIVKDSLVYIKTDNLADSKDHVMSPFAFKMLGLTLDIEEMQASWIVNPLSLKGYTAPEIVSGTYSMKINGKGKWIKKAFKSDQPVDVYVFFEIYPLEAEKLTVEEAKDIKKNEPATRLRVSSNATPLSPAIQRMVERSGK